MMFDRASRAVASARRGCTVAVVCLVLPACVSSSQYVHLSYPPEKEITYQDVDDSDDPLLMPTDCDLSLEVADRRDDKLRIGTFLGGVFGEDRAPVFTEDNVVLWLHDALMYELKLLGFKVYGHDDNPPDKYIDKLAVTLDLVYTNCYFITCNATIRLDTALIAGSAQHNINSDVRASDTLSSRYYTTSSERAIGEALQQSIRRTLDDLGFVKKAESACTVPLTT